MRLTQLHPFHPRVSARACLVGMFSAWLFTGCADEADDVESTPTPAPVSFAALEADILVPTCGFSACHGNGAGGLTLKAGQSYTNLVGVPSVQVPASMRVSPGNPDDSYLIQKLEGAAGIVGDPMPPGTPLDADDLALFRRWVEEGAANN